MSQKRYSDLFGMLGHVFERVELLDEALTHPSSIKERKHMAFEGKDYERLEFLGDRVLGLIIANDLLECFEGADAGQLARRYNALVRRETLADVALDIGLGTHMRLAKGERDSGGAKKPALLANTCEAVIGALFVDGGLEVATQFVRENWANRMVELKVAPIDAKTQLQELANARGNEIPKYSLVRCEGLAHSPIFTMEVSLESFGKATGSAGSKRNAEQEAAARLLQKITG